jgi:hypothetical protein
MTTEPLIYDSQLGRQRPLEECVHMDEEWLDSWSCLRTTLDAIAAARHWEAEAARLPIKLEAARAEAREFHRIGSELSEDLDAARDKFLDKCDELHTAQEKLAAARAEWERELRAKCERAAKEIERQGWLHTQFYDRAGNRVVSDHAVPLVIDIIHAELTKGDGT